MGTYLNPGNAGFERIIKNRYVDKTGLIGLINQTIDTASNLTCISRPRRFGKSYAAQMLCAYYDKTCDSSRLFERFAIAGDDTYTDYLNQYDVIYVDMTYIKPFTDHYGQLVPYLSEKITEELSAAYPSIQLSNELPTTMIHAAELTGNKFIMIIDEWDAPIRENPDIHGEYLEFLRMLFKSSGTTAKIFAAAYMTGILPIKKDGSQSAISDFNEFSMIKPRKFGRFVGFTEEEVSALCNESHIPFSTMKHWYDGYSFRGTGSIYNPNSVMQAVENDDFDSYWTETSAAESLLGYISRDFDGLSQTVTALIGGVEVPVHTNGFANDLTTFRNRDDILTLLIHLGYLAYDEQSGRARIPNEEIRLEFAKTIREVKRDDTIRRLSESDQLIQDVIHMNAEAVASRIEKIHAEESNLHYNNEQALRSVVKRAFFSAYDDFVLFEELPAGDRFADVVYLPKRDSTMPVLVIELKWNRSAEGAIKQIKERHYPKAFDHYGGDILLIGIHYDKDAPAGRRKHTCIIEKQERNTGSTTRTQ
ncbi:MAG: AAA family ATPase [Lachnospiraceae bacterium]|nr:AAA family ATPase [Lachnospiraceae bacterium]